MIRLLIASLLVAATATAGIVQVGSIETTEPVYDMVLLGDTAYLAGGETGLTILDLSDPSQPVTLDTFATGGHIGGVAVAGDLVYVVGGGRLRILDASDPTAIAQLGTVQLGVAGKIALQGEYAYVACGYLGLKIVDISDPLHPFEVNRFDAPQDLHSIAVAVDGDHAYVTNADIGGFPVFIIDISDPDDLWMPGWFYSVESGATAARAGLTYTADWNVFITDVTDPAEPVTTGSVKRMHGRDIELVGDLAYISCYHLGLAIVDVSDPTTPRTAGGFYTGEHALAVAADGDLVLLSNSDQGVWILAVDPATPVGDPLPPANHLTLTAHPNPFNPRTSLHLEVARTGRATLAIHDLRGRRLRTLVDHEIAAGSHDVSWNGADARGLPVPAGVYIAVLTTAHGRATTRLSLVK